MKIPWVHIETLHNPCHYTYAQIEKAGAVAQLLARGKLVLVEPPGRWSMSDYGHDVRLVLNQNSPIARAKPGAKGGVAPWPTPSWSDTTSSAVIERRSSSGSPPRASRRLR